MVRNRKKPRREDVQEECAAEAAEPVEKEVPAKWVPMGFTGMGLLFHWNGSSSELESGSDFNFSFAFDNNNVSDPKSKSKGKAHFLIRLRQQEQQEVVWCSNDFCGVGESWRNFVIAE